MSKLKEINLIVLQFNKNSDKIDVAVSDEEVRVALVNNESTLSAFISSIKDLIPDKYYNVMIKLIVKMKVKKEEPVVYTKIKYPIRLSRYLADFCLTSIEMMNRYFTSVIQVSWSRIGAKQMNILDEDRL